MLIARQGRFVSLVLVLTIFLVCGGEDGRRIHAVDGDIPHRILFDTDVDTDDFFGLLYLLKLNHSEFHLQVCFTLLKILIQSVKKIVV